MKRKYVSILLSALIMGTMFTGCSSKSSTSSNGKVEIEFFHYKPEAKSTFDKLISKFEQENPNIKVTQNTPPEAETLLRTRVSKQDIPDVIGIGADTTFADTVKAGVFEDLSSWSELGSTQSSYIDMVKGVSKSDKVYGIPYAANADGVIYNKKIFADLGLSVPKTWDEFIAVNEKIKAAGKVPFYLTLKDSWTTLPAYNALAANTQGDTFFADLEAGKTTFSAKYKEASDKFVQLMQYGQSDIFGKDYNAGNTAFAKGESAMYLQGIWALAEIKKANPDIDLGVFPYPVTNDPSKTKLVSGVDLLLSQSKTTKHPTEAKKFIDFLLSSETAKTYIDEQKCFSALKGVTQADKILEGLQPSVDNNLLVDFPDHQIPPALGLDKELQTLAQTKDVNKFLTTLDQQWTKTQSRK